jgi:predicted acetyltransferase
MITRDLQESTDRDEVLSVLVAAEYPIYGRFGYGPAVASVELAVEASAQFRRPPDSGWVELVEPATVRAQLPALYEAARRAWPGAIDRDARWWDRDLTPFPGRSDKLPRFVAVSHDPDGRPDGFVTYTTEERWERTRPLGTLHIEDLIGVSDHAYARLWRYCLEVDWIHQVRAGDRSSDELLPWLLVDARQAFEESRGDFQWVRLLDPAAALSGRTYLCEGTVTIEIVDPMGLASGRFALDGSPGGHSADARPAIPTWSWPSTSSAPSISAASAWPRWRVGVGSTSAGPARSPAPTPCSGARSRPGAPRRSEARSFCRSGRGSVSGARAARPGPDRG